MKYLNLILFSIVALTSCDVQRVTVGDGPVGQTPSSVKYSKSKVKTTFWGKYYYASHPPAKPDGCGYQVKTTRTFGSILLLVSTFGFLDVKTQKVLVKRSSPCNPHRAKQYKH